MLDDWLNNLPQISHWWGFMPVCIISCFFKSDFLRKLLSHLLQLKGFTFVWINLWVDKLDIRLKNLPHTLQLKLVSFILSWTFACVSVSCFMYCVCWWVRFQLLIYCICKLDVGISSWVIVGNTSFVSLHELLLEGEYWLS